MGFERPWCPSCLPLLGRGRVAGEDGGDLEPGLAFDLLGGFQPIQVVVEDALELGGAFLAAALLAGFLLATVGEVEFDLLLVAGLEGIHGLWPASGR